jgi:short-subunit dehydrogenase
MKTVLILGGTSDIGVALARKFASNGYNIQLAARRIEDLISISSDIKIRFDVACDRYAFNAEEFNGHELFWRELSAKPDICIVVFGCMFEQKACLNDWELTLKTIQVNYTGVASILNIISRSYKERKAGTIICISSVAGLRGRSSNFIYGSAKAGLIAYLSGLRNELYQNSVNVITVLPGFVFTKMTDNLRLPRLLTATPEEVARDVYRAFLKKKNIVYTKWIWRLIMLVIRHIPESVFKKLKL